MTTKLILNWYKIYGVGNKINKGKNVGSLLQICRQFKILNIREIQQITYKTTKIRSFASFFFQTANSEDLTKQKILDGSRNIN